MGDMGDIVELGPIKEERQGTSIIQNLQPRGKQGNSKGFGDAGGEPIKKGFLSTRGAVRRIARGGGTQVTGKTVVKELQRWGGQKHTMILGPKTKSVSQRWVVKRRGPWAHGKGR